MQAPGVGREVPQVDQGCSWSPPKYSICQKAAKLSMREGEMQCSSACHFEKPSCRALTSLHITSPFFGKTCLAVRMTLHGTDFGSSLNTLLFREKLYTEASGTSQQVFHLLLSTAHAN